MPSERRLTARSNTPFTSTRRITGTSTHHDGDAGLYRLLQPRLRSLSVRSGANRRAPGYWGGGQAFANTIALGETAGFAMDMRDPGALDMVTMFTAHELAHQWWGQQVLGARMQGASLLYETLAQYSALMVARKLGGDDRIRPFLQFQLDRYLSGRRTQVLAEEPLVSVEISQDHIAYGKGALALYLLQRRIGEDAVNRALRRFVDR